METEPRYSIKVVSRRTGLSPHVIRAWERRYNAVSPCRTETNRRLYSDADIERLRLLERATRAGYSIGQIVQLPDDALTEMLAADRVEVPQPLKGAPPVVDQSVLQTYLDECLEAVKRLDTEAVETALTRAAVTLSQPALLERVVIPLMHHIGDEWREGFLRVAHEHLASAVVRTVLGNIRGNIRAAEGALGIVVTTPAGQLHELGALIVAVTAASEGWQVTYLGPNLPAEEIAGAAQQNQARAVALSIIYPTDDPHLVNELRKLRRYLPEETVLLAGGRAAQAYADVLNEIGAIRLDDMQSLRAYLESLQTRSTQTQ